MFSIVKYVLIACGILAIYGIVTEQDLNSLFTETMAKVIPFLESLFASIIAFIKKLF